VSDTLSQAAPTGTDQFGKIAVKMIHVLVLVSLALVPIYLSAAPAADSTLSDSAAIFNSAAPDSLNSDSTGLMDSADSVLQRLARSRSGEQSGRKLDLNYETPGSVFSAKNVSMVLIVIGLLVLFLHFLRKYLFRPLGGGISGGQFQVIRQFHLGPKKSVTLVRFANRLLLLGVTDGNINTLAEIDDPEEVEKIIAEAAKSGDSPGGAFKDIYHNLLAKTGKNPKQ